MKKGRKQILVVVLLFSLAFGNLSNEIVSSATAKKIVKSLKLSQKQVHLKVGEKKKITYKVKVKKSASKKIVVRTNNTKIANVTVKKNRIVLTGKKKGKTKVIVSTKAKNRKGKKIKVVINIVVGQEENTSIQNPKYSHEPMTSLQNTTAPSKFPTANLQKTDMPSVSPTETPLVDTTNPNSTSMPSSTTNKTLETTTFEDFSRAAANLVKENKSTNGSSIAANDEFYAKRLIVKGKDSNIDFESYNATKVIKSSDNIYLVQFATSSDAKTAMSKIINLSNVEYVEADSYSGTVFDKENVGINSKSWGVSKIGADQYAKTIASNYTSEIKVAVVDSGVSNHTFLAGRISSEGYDFVDNDAVPNDLNSHGTHVSGTIVDCTPNLKVNILPVRVLDENGNGYDSIVGIGIRYAADHGAKVINLSLGGEHSQFLDDNILYALGKGVVVVVAAGNDYGNTSNHCPAHMTDVIVVGAVDENDNKASFSNVGSSLDVVAPGVGIVSCVPSGGYKSYQGTSMATPHVSAIAAMFVLTFPDKSPAEIENIIKRNTRDLGEMGSDNYYGHGIPDLSKCAVVMPSSISLNKASATIEKGKTISLTANITPSNATDKTVTWSSSNTSVAIVNEGIVTGKSVGNATITAKTSNGKTATCIVTVKNSVVEVTGISLNSTSILLETGKTTTLIATITPSNATNKTITWSSSNTSVATVSNGVVTGNLAGTATIMAITQNGKIATCQVTVVDESVIKINNAAELMAISNKLDGNYMLAKDIDISASNWKPIGKKNNPFRGTFDGAGYKITGLTIKNIGEGYQGLFGYNKGILKNVNVSGSIAISGSLQSVFVGGICGYSEGGEIRSSINYVNVEVDINNVSTSAFICVGGITGVADMYCTVSECTNRSGLKATVNGNTRTSIYVGGISGMTCNGTLIKKCINEGNIHSYASIKSNKYFLTSYAGGITGSDDLGKLEECINSANIRAEGYSAVKTDYDSVVSAGGVIGYIGSGTESNNTNNSLDIIAIGNEYVTVIRKGNIYGY